jgi:hypothetical protein
LRFSHRAEEPVPMSPRPHVSKSPDGVSSFSNYIALCPHFESHSKTPTSGLYPSLKQILLKQTLIPIKRSLHQIHIELAEQGYTQVLPPPSSLTLSLSLIGKFSF